MKLFVFAMSVAQVFVLYFLVNGVASGFNSGKLFSIVLYGAALVLVLVSLLMDIAFLIGGFPRVVSHPDRIEVAEWIRSRSFRRGTTSVRSFLPRNRLFGVVYLQDASQQSLYFRHLMSNESFETLLALRNTRGSDHASA
ncbi:MAG: hypothetical protein RL594_1170 [Bacteroidota bacterium]|jgi:hypothetical protein